MLKKVLGKRNLKRMHKYNGLTIVKWVTTKTQDINAQRQLWTKQ